MERLPVRSVNLGTGENGIHPDFKAILAYLTCLVTHQDRDYARRISQGASRAVQHSTRVVNIFQDIVAKNYIKRPGVEQVCQLRGIAVFQRNSLRNSCFPRGTDREIQHR